MSAGAGAGVPDLPVLASAAMTAEGGAGYSGRPLAAKLGIQPGFVVVAQGAPADYEALLAVPSPGITVVSRLSARANLVHLFVTKRAELARILGSLRTRLDDEVPVWVSWPKRSSGVATAVTEDVIRACALPLGFVDIKVCAVDATWSGLKLVVRRELRRSASRASGKKG